MTIDTVTAWTRGGLRFLMVQHPTRTSLGIAGGVLVATIADMLKPYLGAINTAALTDFRLAVCGVFVTNISILFNKKTLPEAIEKEFTAVRQAIVEGKLSPAHQKLLYLKIAHNVIDGAALSKKLADEMADVARDEGTRRGAAPSAGPRAATDK